MNDKLKNYATNPDPEVWERIEKTMRRHALRRQAWTGAACAVLVALAVVGVVFWPSDKAEVSQPALPDVAQVMPNDEMPIAVDNQEANVAEMAVGQTKAAAPQSDKVAEAQPATSFVAPKSESSVAASQPMVVPQVAPSVAVIVPTVANEPVSAPAITEAQTQSAPVAEAKTSATPSAKASSGNVNEDTILWLPNVFVPVSDDAEINIFRARLNHPGDVLTNFRMSVFNRSGNLVFMSNDINEGWDGTYRGREMPQAAYIYVIYYTDKDGFRHQRKGTITLVR